jgi:hypothetical protein
MRFHRLALVLGGLALSVSMLSAALPSIARVHAQAQATPAAGGAAAGALLVGSSSVNGAVGRTLERELGALGIRLERHARSSSGFARPDFFDWRAEVARLGPLERHRAVLVYTGGNDGQALSVLPEERESPRERWVAWDQEARWRSLYAERVRGVVDALCARGAPRVVVLPPVDGGRRGWSRRMVRVREAMAEGVRGSRCGTWLDAGGEGVVFDSLDGVHLSWAGAGRMWARIGATLAGLLGAG